MAGHSLNLRPEGHGTAFRVRRGTVTVFFGDGREKPEIPIACRFEEGQCGIEIVGAVALGPGILIEGTNERVFQAEGLAETEAEDDLAIGKMGGNLADAPFTRGWRLVDLRARERRSQLVKPVGGRGEDGNRFLAGQESLVGVQFHDVRTVSRPRLWIEEPSHACKHDHASSQSELGMSKGVVRSHGDGLLSNRNAHEPINGGQRIAIAKAENHSGVHLTAHGEKMLHISRIISKNMEMAPSVAASHLARPGQRRSL